MTRIVLSRDRPAQCDLLLRSLERYAPAEPTVVLYRDGPGYPELRHERRGESFIREFGREHEFQNLVDSALAFAHAAGEETVTFLCDDDVCYRPWPPPGEPTPAELLEEDDELLCVSLRLGRNCVMQYPTGVEQEWPNVNPWEWQVSQGDFAYPGSIDGHVFTLADVNDMLADREYPNPTALECVLADACHEFAPERRLMRSYDHSVLVGVPVNRVSEQSRVRFGELHPAPADMLLAGFLAGRRLDLAAIDFSAVDAAHVELELRWAAGGSGPVVAAGELEGLGAPAPVPPPGTLPDAAALPG